MGIDQDFGWAFAKSQAGAGAPLPRGGTAFISIKESDRPGSLDVVRRLQQLGFTVQATSGTAAYLRSHEVDAETVHKVKEGRPHIVDVMIDGKVDLIINTTVGEQSIKDSFQIRRTALDQQIPYFTTIRGAAAATQAIETLQKRQMKVKPIQLYYK